jgi:hypothetical protein
MSWKIEQHKRGNGTAEIEVSIIVKEMKDYQGSTVFAWIDNFTNRIKNEVKRTNTYSAEFSFKATPRNDTSLEVWKMKSNGDYNYKMFTITKI